MGNRFCNTLYYLLLLSIVFFSAAANAQQRARGLSADKLITQYILDTWEEEDGLPQNSITTIAQTRNGYLWLGTYSNLFRFDGVRFTQISSPNEPNLAHASSRMLKEDSHGNLWYATTNGLFKLTNDVWKHYGSNNGLIDQRVLSICELRDGTILFGTMQGLYRFSEESFTDISKEYGITDGVWSICESRNGEIWLGTNGQGVIRKTSSGNISYTTSNGFPHKIIRTIIEDSNGSLWFATPGSGIVRFANNQFTIFTTKNGLPNDAVRTILEDKNGNLWIGTSGGGLCRFRNGGFEVFSSSNGLTSDAVWSLCEDIEGSLWIGTGGSGLNRLKDSRFVTFTKSEGLSNNFVWTVYEDSKGTQWFGTNGGGVNKKRAESVEKVLFNEKLENKIIRTIVDDGNRLWFGTMLGLYSTSLDKLDIAKKETSIPAVPVIASYRDDKGQLWFGTDGAGLWLYAKNSFHSFGTDTTAPGKNVRVIKSIDSVTMFIGTQNNALIMKLNDGKPKFDTLHLPMLMDGNGIRSFYRDNNRVFWIGTDGSGLIRYEKGNVTRYDVQHGFDATVVHEIIVDNDNNFWLSCNKGIFRVAHSELNAVAKGEQNSAQFQLYTKADGMRSSECNGGGQPAGWKNNNGSLMFPTIIGVTFIDPEKLWWNTIPPTVLIERVELDSNIIADTTSLTLDASVERITFQFTALSLAAPERMRFRYKLEGFDRRWMDVQNTRSATYTHLPAGNYRFVVSASNNDGAWNHSGTSISFTKKPRFYQTTWFIMLCIVVSIGSAYGIYRIRIRVMQQHEKELLELVDLRTHDLREEKEKTEAALLETEEARNEAELQKERAVKANQTKTDVLNIVAHDLKNPLTTVSGISALLEEGGFGEMTVQESAKAIRRSSEYMIALIGDLEHIDEIERGDIHLKNVRFKLSELVGYVASMNRLQAEKKEQILEFTPCQSGSCVVVGDREKLQRAIDNLIGNAVKYSPIGAHIAVNVSHIENRVRFSVCDEGPGISEEDMKKLFGKFQRLSARPTGDESSTGLGLSIVKMIVDLHKGNVWAENNVGKGSTFIVEMPSETSTIIY